jgi:hypothetical protein
MRIQAFLTAAAVNLKRLATTFLAIFALRVVPILSLILIAVHELLAAAIPTRSAVRTPSLVAPYGQ